MLESSWALRPYSAVFIQQEDRERVDGAGNI